MNFSRLILVIAALSLSITAQAQSGGNQATTSPQVGQSQPLTPAEIARRAFPSVVLLSMQDARGQPVSLGSGFFIDKDVVATNFHVIDGAAAGYAKVIGQPAKLNIKGVIALDAVHDLALLQLEPSLTTPLPVAAQLSANIGDAVYAIGNPEGLEGTFSQGIVSSLRTVGSDRILQITAPISPGSSGGPVLDQNGTVVGVSVASITKGQNLNFAIPADYISALQKNKTELHPFKTVPRAKSVKTLLGQLGSEQPTTGVVGENFLYDRAIGYGPFTFSLRNNLAQDVAMIRGIIIFYDIYGQPIDVSPIKYEGTIPAHLAKRIRGGVDESVKHLNSPPSQSGYPSPELPKGKVEFRILDFAVK
jgi:hypothetical protein